MGERDLFGELRSMGLTSDQCSEVLEWLKTLPIKEDTLTTSTPQCECLTLIKKGESAMCGDCKLYHDWFCPKSPDQQCHYYSEKHDDGYAVSLRNGKTHILEGYEKGDADFESDDWCIFCGKPEERK